MWLISRTGCTWLCIQHKHAHSDILRASMFVSWHTRNVLCCACDCSECVCIRRLFHESACSFLCWFLSGKSYVCRNVQRYQRSLTGTHASHRRLQEDLHGQVAAADGTRSSRYCWGVWHHDLQGPWQRRGSVLQVCMCVSILVHGFYHMGIRTADLLHCMVHAISDIFVLTHTHIHSLHRCMREVAVCNYDWWEFRTSAQWCFHGISMECSTCMYTTRMHIRSAHTWVHHLSVANIPKCSPASLACLHVYCPIIACFVTGKQLVPRLIHSCKISVHWNVFLLCTCLSVNM